MSKVAWSRNCLVCPHFARRHQGALEGPDCPCPQDAQGALIRPERVRRSQPPGWKCPTLAKAKAGEPKLEPDVACFCCGKQTTEAEARKCWWHGDHGYCCEECWRSSSDHRLPPSYLRQIVADREEVTR